MRKSIIIWTIAIVLVVSAVYTTYQYNNSPATKPNDNAQVQNNTAPEQVLDSMDAMDFKLKDLDGKEVSLSDYKGKAIYLNFWATWCGYCTDELPYIQQLNEDNKDSDLVILTIDLQETDAEVRKFMSDNKYTFPVLLDTNGDASSKYGVQGIPLSLLIDKDFKIISAHEGYMENYEMLKEFVNQINE